MILSSRLVLCCIVGEHVLKLAAGSCLSPGYSTCFSGWIILGEWENAAFLWVNAMCWCAHGSDFSQVLRGRKTAASPGEFSPVYLSRWGGTFFGWIWISCGAEMREGEVCGSRQKSTFSLRCCECQETECVEWRDACELPPIWRISFIRVN